MTIKSFCREYMPSFAKNIIKRIIWHKHNQALITKIIRFYSKKENLDLEKKPYIDYLRKHRFYSSSHKQMVFLSKFVEKYIKNEIILNRCDATGLHYILHNNKRLYWKRGVKPKEIKEAYAFLLAEQDTESPHLYWQKNDHLVGKTLFDIGAAEGMITLNEIDRIKNACLFESDIGWQEALFWTFEPYMEKVTIVMKQVADKTNEKANSVSIDDFVELSGIVPQIIKIDIEGQEEKALMGARQLLSDPRNNIKLVICVYHNQNSEKNLAAYLTDLKYTSLPSRGFMFITKDSMPPYLRHGVLRAEKINS